MRVSVNSAVAMVIVLFGLLLVPRAALASTANCPTEPASNVRIADGEIFTGSNCNLYTVGDVDSFVFTGTNGDTYQVAAALNGGSNDICMTVYNGTVQIYSGCTNTTVGPDSVAPALTLTATGTITIDITEQAPSATQNYAVSMERIYPSAPNAVAVSKLGESVAGSLPYLTDSNEWTFNVATTGEYRVTAAPPSGTTQDICMTVYQPSGTSAGVGCTNTTVGPDSVVIDFTPTANGTSMAFVGVDGNDATLASYDFEVSCLVGTCPPLKVPPSCTLEDALSYDASTSTLTMDFTIGNTYAATWNAWLVYQNTMTSIFSIAQPITNPPVAITKTYTGLSAEGKVGVLSTLTTSKAGIKCSSWEQISTGTGP
jgi:hypothetical protein